MTEEHLEEHLNREGRLFHFSDKVTYIERQEITVQAGAIFHNGPANGETIKENSKTEIPDNVPTLMTVEDKIRYCIRMLERDALINFKQDYGAVLKVIQEKRIKFFTNESFATFVNTIEEVPERHRPNEGNLKMITFSERHLLPDWKVVGCDDAKNSYYQKIGKMFWELFCKLQ